MVATLAAGTRQSVPDGGDRNRSEGSKRPQAHGI